VSPEPSPGPGRATAAEPTLRLDAARAAARLAKQLEVALAEVNLSLPQYRALAFLSTGGLAPSALAGQLAVSKPTITALVDGLVARGFVARTPDEHDRRRVEHRLTAAGSRELDAADRAVTARLDQLARHLDPDRAVEAMTGLARWSDALDTARAAAIADATTPEPRR
jgi:long-chain acyl-CoA synthetase